MLSFILGMLKQTLPPEDNAILHFFFRNDDNKTTSPVTMAATLTDQLIQKNKTAECVEILYKARSDSNVLQCNNFSEIWELFMTLIQYWKDKPLYILIDALDECASYGPFLQKLASTDWGKLRVQFILSSRALEDIKTPLKRMPVDTIRIINMK